jgi:hypothetical protein
MEKNLEIIRSGYPKLGYKIFLNGEEAGSLNRYSQSLPLEINQGLNEILIKGRFYQPQKKFIIANDGRHNYTIILASKWADFLFLLAVAIGASCREWIHLLYLLPVIICLCVPSYLVIGKVEKRIKEKHLIKSEIDIPAE